METAPPVVGSARLERTNGAATQPTSNTQLPRMNAAASSPSGAVFTSPAYEGLAKLGWRCLSR